MPTGLHGFMIPALIALPAAFALLLVAFVGPLVMGMLRSGAGPRGTPSSSEASYDPVSDPGDRTS